MLTIKPAGDDPDITPEVSLLEPATRSRLAELQQYFMSHGFPDPAGALRVSRGEGRVEDTFRLYAVSTYRQHNPLIEDGMEGLRKVVTWLTDARC